MAFPVYVGATAQQNINNTPVAYNVPAGVQTGDLLFVMVNTAPASSNNLVLPAGWTQIQANTDDLFREKLTVAYAVHTGAASYTFSTSNSLGGRVRMIAYRGQAANNPINSSALAYSQAAGATLATTPIAAAAGVDSIEICFAADLDNRNTTVSGAGVTSRLNSPTWLSFDIADANAAAGANTSAKTFTWGFAGTKRTIINVVVSGTAAATVPVTFSGTVSTQTATVGSAFNLDLSTFFTGNQTPFAYSLVAGNLTGTGLSLNTSTGVISGTPTGAGAIGGLQVMATDTASNTAQTNTFSINVQAAGIGSAVTYSVPSRTFAAAVTATAPTVAGLSFTGLCNNMGVIYNSGTLTVRAYNQTTGALVVTKTATVATGGNASVTDAALVVGTSYDCWLQLGTGEYGAVKVTAA